MCLIFDEDSVVIADLDELISVVRISRTCSSLTVEPHDVNNGTRSVIDTKPATFAMLRVTTMSRVTTLIRRRKSCVLPSVRTTGTAK